MTQQFDDPLGPDDLQALGRTVLRIQARGWALAIGLLCGLGLFVATNLLVLKGGDVVGPHLALLAGYFPGYRVTFAGSLLGFLYAFVVGYLCGWAIATLYNRLTSGMR